MPEAPVGMPEAFEEHIKLMFDLQVLAYQAEITRISTMMYARDTSGATYPGERRARRVPHRVAPLERARAHGHVRADQPLSRADARLLPREAAGHARRRRHLLDHSVVLYGSSMSNGNQHDHDPLPILVAGGASGQLKGDRHLAFPAHTPMSNLLLSHARQAGRAPGQLRRQHAGKLEI